MKGMLFVDHMLKRHFSNNTLLVKVWICLMTLFFLWMYARNCRFPRCSYPNLSLSVPSLGQKKKCGEIWTLTSAGDLTLHSKPVHRVAVISSPNPFRDQLWRSSVLLYITRSLAKMHTVDSLLSTAECRKSTKNSLQAWRSGSLIAENKQKKSPGLRHRRVGREQGHLFFEFCGRLLDRWCSSGHMLFSSAIYNYC